MLEIQKRLPLVVAVLAVLSLCFVPLAEAGDGEKSGPDAKEAPRTEQVPNQAAEFTLKDVAGKSWTLSSLKGKVVVLEWTNHGCPYVIKHYNSNNMQTLQKKYTGQGVVWLTICSSASGQQGHMSNEQWKAKLKKLGAAATATLTDENGAVGRAYGAKTTPQFCLINAKGSKVYEGAIDDNKRAGLRGDYTEIAKARSYITEALDAVLAGKEVAVKKTRPYGCNVKYAN